MDHWPSLLNIFREEFLFHLLAGFVQDGVGNGPDVFADGGGIEPLQFRVQDELGEGKGLGRPAVFLREAHSEPALCGQLVDKGHPLPGY